MAVPDFQSFFRPLLDVAGDGEEHSLKEAREKIAADFHLSEEDLNELLPSGTQRKFHAYPDTAHNSFLILCAKVQNRMYLIERRGTEKQGAQWLLYSL